MLSNNFDGKVNYIRESYDEFGSKMVGNNDHIINVKAHAPRFRRKRKSKQNMDYTT
jgi:hypothetical protein